MFKEFSFPFLCALYPEVQGWMWHVHVTLCVLEHFPHMRAEMTMALSTIWGNEMTFMLMSSITRLEQLYETLSVSEDLTDFADDDLTTEKVYDHQEGEASQVKTDTKRKFCISCGKKYSSSDAVLKHVKKEHKNLMYTKGKPNTYCC